MGDKIKVACMNMNVVFNKKANIAKMMRLIDKAAAKGVRLIVFPEVCLQGYLYNVVGMSEGLEDVRYAHENAEVIPDGKSVRALIKKAKEANMYIIWGMVEKDKNYIDTIYNSAVLVGPEGYIGTYRKVHQPADELHFFAPGEDWPVFETSIGKIGMLICHDKWFPEATRELTIRGADIIAFIASWVCEKPGDETDRFVTYYDKLDSVRAFENVVWYISSNNVGHCEKSVHNFCGQGKIVAPSGNSVVELGFKEDLGIAEIDVKGGILEGRYWNLLGINLLRDRRPNTYKTICRIGHPRELIQE
jgi:predicted amidohydrolase